MAINGGGSGNAGHFFGGHHIWQSGINAKLLLDPYDYQYYTGAVSYTHLRAHET